MYRLGMKLLFFTVTVTTADNKKVVFKVNTFVKNQSSYVRTDSHIKKELEKMFPDLDKLTQSYDAPFPRIISYAGNHGGRGKFSHKVEIGTFSFRVKQTEQEVKQLVDTFEKKQKKEKEDFLQKNKLLPPVFSNQEDYESAKQKSNYPYPDSPAYLINIDQNLIYLIQNQKQIKLVLPRNAIDNIIKENTLIHNGKREISSYNLFDEAFSLIKKYEIYPSLKPVTTPNVQFFFGRVPSFATVQPTLNTYEFGVSQTIGAKVGFLVDGAEPLFILQDAQQQKNIANIEMTKSGMEIKFPCKNSDKETTKNYCKEFFDALKNAKYPNCELKEIDEKNSYGHYTASVVIQHDHVKRFLLEICQLREQDYDDLYKKHPDFKPKSRACTII